jgi:hypothetical protein
MNKPIRHPLLPLLTLEHLQSIWCQLPQIRRVQLTNRLFFLALEQAGGISHEFSTSHSLSRSSSQDSGAAPQEIGGDLGAPIVAVPGRASSGESEASVPVD